MRNRAAISRLGFNFNNLVHQDYTFRLECSCKLFTLSNGLAFLYARRNKGLVTLTSILQIFYRSKQNLARGYQDLQITRASFVLVWSRRPLLVFNCRAPRHLFTIFWNDVQWLSRQKFS